MRKGRNPDVIGGRVSMNGTVLAGKGFLVTRASLGTYILNFDEPFVIESITATVMMQQFNFVLIDQVTGNTCRIQFANPAASALQDATFMFTAIGA